MLSSCTITIAFLAILLPGADAASHDGVKDTKSSNFRRELAPAPSPTANKKCFSGENTVEVLGEGVVPMSTLKIGDYVKAGDDKYSRVYSFSHIEENIEADYLQLISDAGVLEISPEHMVFTNTAIPASQVKVGDMLGEYKVSEIKKVKRSGAYAPVTESGNIIVSGVLASSYVALLEYSAINQHKIAHAAMAPHRLACQFNFGLCKGETYDAEGLSNSGFAVIKTAQYFAEQSPVVQFGATIVAAPILATAYSIEQMLMNPAVVVVTMGVAAYFYKKTKFSKVKEL